MIFFDIDDIKNGEKITIGMLNKRTQTKVAEHMVVCTGLPRQQNQYPILLSISDLHMGQGKGDGAEEVYPELEAAYVSVIDKWDKRVQTHRENNTDAPAFLVLNGDILDFWSADLKPDTTSGHAPFVADVYINNKREAQVTDDQASNRMRRIIDAHKDFFKSITNWVDANQANYCFYVCGNHDDHLAKFDLGRELAESLHSERAFFAYKTIYFPALKTICEHGHRIDEYNTWNDKFSNGFSSFGELLVSMCINPVERGGPSLLDLVRAGTGNAGFPQLNGMSATSIRELAGIYTYFGQCWQIDRNIYESYFGCINNLDKKGVEEVPAVLGEIQLRSKSNNAKNDIQRLKALWLESEFQTIKEKIAGALSDSIPTSLATYLLNRGDNVNELKFDENTGLLGNDDLKVHLVGHTHNPVALPDITGNNVAAQHINTGTGQDTWEAKNGGWFSKPSLTPLQSSHYALVYLLPHTICIEAGDYRSLQDSNPTVKSNITGSLNPLHRPNRIAIPK